MTITLSRVAKTFSGGNIALKPTDLNIQRGEILALLGPSGCGKTTLLRILAGLETGDAGSQVMFDDEPVTDVPVEKRRVGMVFQSYALFPNMNVRCNVGYGLKMQGMPLSQRNKEVDVALAMCKLSQFANRSVKTLSGGQCQRVAVARAIAPKPKVLLLDEPLSALDAALRVELRDELAILLRRSGITAVFVTHDQSEALAIADRVAVMNLGSIEQIGDPQTLYKEPANSFVASFIGGAIRLGRMVKPDDAGSGSVLHTLGGTVRLPLPDHGKDVFVRAEGVRVERTGPLKGTVVSATYHGTHYKLAIENVCETTIYATIEHGLTPGAEVSLQLVLDKLILI